MLQGENEMKKYRKVIKIILFFLQIIGLIWLLLNVLYFLADAKTSMIMRSNPIIYLLLHIHWEGIPSLVSFLISFVNVIYFGHDFLSLYKSGESSKKGFTGQLFYILFSLGALILHFSTIVYKFNSIIRG